MKRLLTFSIVIHILSTRDFIKGENIVSSMKRYLLLVEQIVYCLSDLGDHGFIKNQDDSPEQQGFKYDRNHDFEVFLNFLCIR